MNAYDILPPNNDEPPLFSLVGFVLVLVLSLAFKFVLCP